MNDVMISARGLVKTFGKSRALDGLDLEVNRGDVFGFIGRNGAGKTTTLRILATLLQPTAGEASVAGHDIRRDAVAVRRAIGYMPDSFGVYEDMVVADYLSFFAAAYGIRGAPAKQVVTDVLELVDLSSRRDVLVKTLSRGMQQRLGLARTLVHDPDVLLLDEPASGLDPGARIEVRELVRELARMGKTILLSSHILHELGDLCSRIAIVERGRMLFSGSIAEVLARVQKEHIVRLRVASGDENRALEIIRTVDGVLCADAHDGEIVVEMTTEMTETWRIPQALVAANLRLVAMGEDDVDLEDVFLRVTAEIEDPA